MKIGDYVTGRWRDKNGTFDAAAVKIVHIFKTNVPAVDTGILWIPLEKHQEMMNLPDQATILVANQETGFGGSIVGWDFKDHHVLLTEFREMIEAKNASGYIMFLILMSLGVSLTQMKVFSLKSSLISSVGRVIIGPIIGFLIIKIFNLSGFAAGVLLIQSAMPSAILTYLVAEMYSPKKVVDSISSMIVVSTLMSLITVPIIVFISLQYFPY